MVVEPPAFAIIASVLWSCSDGGWDVDLGVEAVEEKGEVVGREPLTSASSLKAG